MAAARRLTPGQAQIIRARYVSGCHKNGAAALSAVFGISPAAIRDIAAGRSYSDVSGDNKPLSDDVISFVRRWLVPCHKERGWNAFAKALGVHPNVLRAFIKN